MFEEWQTRSLNPMTSLISYVIVNSSLSLKTTESELECCRERCEFVKTPSSEFLTLNNPFTTLWINRVIADWPIVFLVDKDDESRQVSSRLSGYAYRDL